MSGPECRGLITCSPSSFKLQLQASKISGGTGIIEGEGQPFVGKTGNSNREDEN